MRFCQDRSLVIHGIATPRDCRLAQMNAELEKLIQNGIGASFIHLDPDHLKELHLAYTKSLFEVEKQITAFGSNFVPHHHLVHRDDVEKKLRVLEHLMNT